MAAKKTDLLRISNFFIFVIAKSCRKKGLQNHNYEEICKCKSSSMKVTLVELI